MSGGAEDRRGGARPKPGDTRLRRASPFRPAGWGPAAPPSWSEAQGGARRGVLRALPRHLRDVYRYAYYRVGNHHDAEDLTEQTFLQAYRHFERAQRESRGRPLRPWLIRIAHNLAANLYRDRSRRPVSPIVATDTLSDLHTTEDLVENRSELSRVLEGVRQLPDDRREALIMRFALDMDNREIARALGRSDGATKVLIHRAIKQLEGLVADASDERADEMRDVS